MASKVDKISQENYGYDLKHMNSCGSGRSIIPLGVCTVCKVVLGGHLLYHIGLLEKTIHSYCAINLS